MPCDGLQVAPTLWPGCVLGEALVVLLPVSRFVLAGASFAFVASKCTSALAGPRDQTTGKCVFQPAFPTLFSPFPLGMMQALRKALCLP